MSRSSRLLTATAAGIAAVAGLTVVVTLPGGAAPSGPGYTPNEGGPGTIVTVAGKSPSGYSGDGAPARDAAMNEPRMLTFDGAGTMYIVDTFNQVIRRVGRDGEPGVAGGPRVLVPESGVGGDASAVDGCPAGPVLRLGKVGVL